VKLLLAIKRLENAAGGSERVICQLANALSFLGHEVTLVSYDKNDSESFYYLNNKVKRVNLNHGDIEKPATIKSFLTSIVKLRHAIKKEKPDAVIAFMHSMYVPVSISSLFSGIKVLACEHSAICHYKKNKGQFLLIKLISPLIYKFIFLSGSIAKEYPKNIFDKSLVIPNPVCDKTLYECTEDYNKDKVILSVGRFDKYKRHGLLLNSFISIANKYPEWKLVILGDGESRITSLKKIKALGLDDNIIMPGVKKNIWDYYKCASIFISTSLYEGFGLSAAEAMFFKCAPIGFSDCSGINELIENKTNGLLIGNKNNEEKEVALALSSLIDREDVRKKYGVNARKKIIDNYSPPIIFSKWQKLLEEL
jgi:glycosyltransferase involved in cell wall biosynthesis